ncbi:MAG: repair protein RecN [Bacteroidota bacterium]
MLKQLQIRNFALIDHVELDFEQGFTVLTGETGSGKSILLGALGLILGDRADFSVIGPNGEKAVAEALFSIDIHQYKPFLDRNDLDLSPEIVIRREIHSNGKSRAFINDTPVALGLLREITGTLFYIHSQYNTVELKSAAFQLELLDSLAGLSEESERFRKNFIRYESDRLALEDLRRKFQELQNKSDYDQFQLEELLRLDLEKNDFKAIEQELSSMSRSEEVREAIVKLEHCTNGDGQAGEQLKQIEGAFKKLEGVHPDVDEIQYRLTSILLDLKDVTNDASRFLDRQSTDPERIALLSSLVDEYNRVLRKHNMISQEELIGYCSELQGRSQDLSSMEEEIRSGELNIAKQKSLLEEAAQQLHSKRKEFAPKIADRIITILSSLKLSGTRLEFELCENETLTSSGCTVLRMLFSANVGIPLVPIESAASGGELSRVMLALHRLLSDEKNLPTILFDEIDTGVSGDVAEKMGKLLSEMSVHRQLIAITHLPQVAAKGTCHLKVEKVLINGRSQSGVRGLNPEERTQEIARLLSGEKITDAAIENAKMLMR